MKTRIKKTQTRAHCEKVLQLVLKVLRSLIVSTLEERFRYKRSVVNDSDLKFLAIFVTHSTDAEFR